MVNYSQSESTISRGEDSAASKMAANWILRDKLYSTFCIERPGAADANSRQALETASKGFRLSFTQPKIGSRH